MAGPTPTYSAIVAHTSSFLAELIADPLLRCHLLSAAAAAAADGQDHRAATLQALSLVSDASASASPSPSSLRAAERLLLSLPSATPLSCLLLALACAGRRRGGAAAAAAVLDLFALDPALARHEIAPAAFESLFAPRLLPVMRHFAARRAAAASANGGHEEDRSVETAAMRVLSTMSGAQAQEMRGLEREYDKVLDLNCRAYALYLKNIIILQAGEDARLSSPPPPPELVFGVEENGDEEDAMATETPMWDDLYPRGSSFKAGRRDLMRPPSLYPHLIMQQQHQSPATSREEEHHRQSPAVLSEDSVSLDDSSSDGKQENGAASLPLSKPRTRGDDDQLSPEPASSPMPLGTTTPKDFVCPITSQVFDDPVTLETGQTYERRAIQEWLDRGNDTCPITRHRLHGAQLPKTNYVLKRLIAAWHDNQHQSSSSPASPVTMDQSPAPSPLNNKMSSPSPTSVIALASHETAAAELRAAVSCLCTSDDLVESEKSVLKIHRLWRAGASHAADHVFAATLSRPAVINGFVEILFNSVSAQVLQVAVFLLAELASRDAAVAQTLTRVDADVDCLVALFKKGLLEAVSLVYLLAPAPEQLVDMDMADALVAAVVRRGGDEDPPMVKMCVEPKAASLILLSQLLIVLVEGDADSSSTATVVPRAALLSERFIAGVVASLEADMVDERLAAVRILLWCVGEDGHCRSRIVDKASSSFLGAVLDAFHVVGDADKFDIVRFLYDLLKLKKRSAAERVLRTIKEAGNFSTMHTLLVYLQSTPPEHSPVVAGLLLQLDLLVEPRNISMYREEAMDSLIQCLKNTDFPRSQLLAAETIMSLPGKFSSSGRPLTRSSLLKLARVKERHRQSQDLTNVRGEDEMEEAKAVSEWERKTAYALVSHEFGLVFEALSECLKTKNAELFTTSLVCATWLVYMLSLLPDTGVLGAARVCLLRQFVVVLRSAKHGSDRVLAMVALRSFMNDREGMHDITTYIKDVLKTLRDLKKSSGLAFEMLKLLSDGQESSVDMWNHKEINLVDCSSNGEVTSVVYFKSYIFSGHSDGTLKVWEGSENILCLVHESQEHTKAITSLAVLHAEEKIFSGSLDKTIRVWQFWDSLLRCVEIHDTRDAVQNLVVANAMACFVPQGAGVKLLTWNGNSKLLNPNKYVRSMALLHGKLFCGCSDSSIQEIDLASGTLGVIQSGNKRILGKANPIYSLQVHDGLLYTGSTSLDGASVKVWNSSNYSLVGSIPSLMEARSLVVSADLIYLGSRNGAVEIWSREKLTKIGSLQAGGPSCRVQCMAVDGDGDVLVVGTSDGRIQAWGLT